MTLADNDTAYALTSRPHTETKEHNSFLQVRPCYNLEGKMVTPTHHFNLPDLGSENA